MKAIFVNVLLGATLLLAPLVISRVAQDALQIPAFFGLGLPITAATTAETAADVGMSREKAMQTVKAVTSVASDDGGMLTCDDLGSCPEGWSLVASPSLILCGQMCKKETCCSADQASEVIEVKEMKERRLLANDNETATMTATTTVTSTTTVYSPMVGNNDTNTSTTTTTATISITTTTTGTNTFTSTMTASTTVTETLSDNEETVLEFDMTITMTAGQLQDFLDNAQVKESFEESMAEELTIPPSWVHVELAAKRRLSEGSAHLRRLASVTVTYTITIPAPANLPATGLGSAVTLAAVQSDISSTDVAALTTAVDGKLATKGLENTFSVTIDSIGTITVDVRTLTTTSTLTNPVIEDDSFAFTKVACTPAHVFALLAMVLMAMSS